MLVRWNLSRYARCYENSQEQYSDCQGRPLFDLLPCIQQCVRMSQTFNSQHLPSSANFKQPPELSIESCDRASLSVKCKPWESTTTDDQSINLEYLEFPSIASLPGFKVSPRETSLGFRYPSKSSTFNFFQIIFPSPFECRLCWDQLSRLGLLNFTWLSLQASLIQLNSGMQWTPPPENNTIHADFDSLLVCGTKQNMINPNRNPNFFNERIHTEPPISMHEYVQKEGNYDTLIENQLEEYSKIKLSVESNIRYDHLKKLINIPLAKKHDFDDQNQACTSGKIPNNNDEENNVSFNIAQKNLQNIKQQESEVQKPIDSNTPTEFRIGMNFSQDLMSIIHDNHLNSANKPCEKFAVNENFAGLEVKLKNHSSPELQNTNTKMSDGLDSQETVIEIHRSIQNENTGIEKKRRQLIASNHIYSSSSDSSNDEITQLVDEMVGSGFSS